MSEIDFFGKKISKRAKMSEQLKEANKNLENKQENYRFMTDGKGNLVKIEVSYDYHD